MRTINMRMSTVNYLNFLKTRALKYGAIDPTTIKDYVDFLYTHLPKKHARAREAYVMVRLGQTENGRLLEFRRKLTKSK